MTTVAGSSTPSPSESQKYPFNKPDKFVDASPLAVAAACRDGVAILALHTAPSHEPLLMQGKLGSINSDTNVDQCAEEGDIAPNDDNTAFEATADNSQSHPLDLPGSYRGPFRIDIIDGLGTALICAGWRTDCTSLAEKCRSVASEDAALFQGMYIGGSLDIDHGQQIADAATIWMAQCAFSDRVRSLSCVGLLASCGAVGRGYLWLVDGTGAYRTRAHAVGNGSNLINRKLVSTDFSVMTKEEGAKRLLKFVAEEGLGNKASGWYMPGECRVEMLLVDSVKRKAKRIFSHFPPQGSSE